MRDILIKCLEELSPILRTVFVLRDIEGLSIEQTAEVLDVSHTAVKARLWRARLQLREGLNQYFSKQTRCARRSYSPQADKQIGFSASFADCLGNSIPRAHEINVAASDMHAATCYGTDRQA